MRMMMEILKLVTMILLTIMMKIIVLMSMMVLRISKNVRD